MTDFEVGDRVRALTTIIEGDVSPLDAAPMEVAPCEVGWIHAMEGDPGVVVHVEEQQGERLATVRFDIMKTATLVFSDEVEKVPDNGV